jgi:GntR family transcriptional repressor for pyruvate dehydrogenase complex
MTSPLPAFEIDIRESLESELARKLIDYFASSKLRAGDRIPSERQMSEALGVGRAALRSSLKSLSLLGVVEQKPGSGTYLRNAASDLLPRVVEWGILLGEHRMDEVLEAREHIEILLAGLAASRRTDADIARLRQLIEEMRRSGGDADQYVSLDIAFHLAIADAARNELIAGILRNLQSLLHAWASRVIHAAGETETSLAVHIPILEAIEAGDADGAQAAMTAHMQRATRRLRAAVEAERGSAD